MSLSEIFANPVLADSVFRFLALEDMKNAVLVCRGWRDHVEIPKFWMNVKMRIKNEGIFRSARIQAVRSLQVDRDTDSQLLDQLLSYLESNDAPLLLEYLEFSFTNLSSLSCEILAAAVCQVQEVVCWNTVITTDQVQTLCTAIRDCQVLRLKKLNLRGQEDVSRVGADILAMAIVRLEEVDISATDLTTEQLDTLFTTITTCSQPRLRKLKLCSNTLSGVAPDTLAGAVCCVESIGLGDTQLTPAQLLAVCSAVSGCQVLGLKELDVGHNDALAAVPADILAAAVTRLEGVNMTGDNILSTDQLNSVFLSLANSSVVTLRMLDLKDNNLSGVCGRSLAAAVCKVETVEMRSARLTVTQLETLCRGITDTQGTNLKLKKLTLTNNENLKLVSPDILASAVCNIEEMNLNLWVAELATIQLETIFRAIKECSVLKLKKLKVSDQDLSSVAAETLAEAVTRLEDVNLATTNLTTEQVEVLFTSISHSSQLRLRKLDLHRTDLSAVAPRILASAVCRVEQVSLEYTELTPGHLAAVSRVTADQELSLLRLRYLDISDNEDLINVEDTLASLQKRLVHVKTKF